MRDLRDHVVEAFDVLDVDGRIDIDAVARHFLDIEIALGMTAARRVGVGEFIDQHDLRPARDDRIEIHLLEPLALIVDPPARHHFEPLQQRFGLRASVGFDHADDDIVARLLPGARAQQHFIGLADAGRGPEEYLQPADTAALPAGRLQEAHPARVAVQCLGADLP